MRSDRRSRVSPRARRGLAGFAAAAALAVGARTLEAQTVRLELNRSEMTMQDQALVSVTVEGAGRAVPNLPTLASFAVQSAGTQDQFSMVNGSFSRRVIYQWVLLPKEVGDFEIGPASIEVNGATYQSDVVTLKVLPASAQPRSARPVFVTASVSDTDPYVGEQLLFVWRFYRRARIADPRLDSLDLGGFLVEDLGEMGTFQVMEGGVQYEVAEIRKALFAQRPGAITIPPSRLVVQLVQSSQSRRGLDPFGGVSSPFDEFFGRMRTETVNLATEPITVTARALPPPPEGFSGLVGEFKVTSSLSSTEVAVGESLTQKIVVSGSGNLNMMGDLPLDELDGFKVYRDQPQVEVTRSVKGIGGTKTFSRALVPLTAGSTQVPETRLVFFDPSQETFRTSLAPAVAIDVAPNGAAEDLNLTEALSAGSGKVAVRILADDLRPIRGGTELVEGRATSAMLPLLLALPPIAFAGLLMARRRADRFASDVGLRRRRGALRTALGAIGKRGELESRDASSVLRRYIGDRVGAEGQALTPRECAERLSALGASEGLVGEVRTLLERFEAADFGGGGGGPIPGSRAAHRDRAARARAAERALMRRLGPSASASNMIWRIALISTLVAGAAAAWAQDAVVKVVAPGDPAQTLSRANDAYAAGDFGAAIAGYRALLDSGRDHPLLHYDLGNAYLRQGELGRAIASYRRAAVGAPRDQDVSANLAYARKRARDAVAPPEAPMVWRTVFAWHYTLSRSELWTAVVVLNAMLWSLLALRLWWRSEAVTWAAVVTGVVLAAAATSLAWHELAPTRVAVVLPREIDARAGNQSESVVRFKLHAGSEVVVRDESGGWLRIVLPSGEQGWIEAKQAEVVEL